MLHPKLQAQINEYLDKKDPSKITHLFQRISQTYYEYEEQIKETSALELARGIVVDENASA
jgi:hypothetical protein